MVSSGVPALDQLLGGGYPDKSAVLVVGPPGIGKEALGYWFIHSGLVLGDFCVYLTRLSVHEVLEDLKAHGLNVQDRPPLWIAAEGGERRYEPNDLASLSFTIKEVLKEKGGKRIRIVVDVLSSLLMLNSPDAVYRFLVQLLSEVKRYDVVLLATIEEGMHHPQILASMQQLFDGVIQLTAPEGGKAEAPLIRVKKMRGKSVPLDASVDFPIGKDRFERRSPTLGRPEKNRLAVLPMANFSPNTSDEYFADGMTEELISVLSQVQGLRVISRTSVDHYRGKGKRVSEIGKELEVGSVMEGSVRMDGDRLRITVQLIDASNEEHVWSENYDRRLEDIFAIQSDIARKVAEALKVKLLAREEERLDQRSVGNIPAYTEYLKGRALLARRKPSELVEAKEVFEAAIAQDPTYAPAYAGLADAYFLLGEYYSMPLEVARKRGKEVLSKALQLDSGLAEAHASLAAQLMNDYNFLEAEGEFKRALSLSPSLTMAHMWYAQCLGAMGRLDEELAEYRLAEEIDPLSVIVLVNEMFALMVRGMETEAWQKLKKATELDPESVLIVDLNAYYYYMKGDFATGISFLEAHPQFHGEAPIMASIALLYAAKGEVGGAMKWLEKFLALPETIYGRASYTATVYAELGDHDNFFLWANRAIDRKEMKFDGINSFRAYRQMRSDPRWAELLARANLKP